MIRDLNPSGRDSCQIYDFVNYLTKTFFGRYIADKVITFNRLEKITLQILILGHFLTCHENGKAMSCDVIIHQNKASST